MRTLADAIAAFHADMAAPAGSGRVTLVVMSEFGRKARRTAARAPTTATAT